MTTSDLNLTPEEQALADERQQVYGPPKENHDGIAHAWVGLLQPHWEKIRDGGPIPAWTVALMLAAMKLNRMRRVFKQDNYDDIMVYLKMAMKWQGEEQEPYVPLTDERTAWVMVDDTPLDLSDHRRQDGEEDLAWDERV